METNAKIRNTDLIEERTRLLELLRAMSDSERKKVFSEVMKMYKVRKKWQNLNRK